MNSHLRRNTDLQTFTLAGLKKKQDKLLEVLELQTKGNSEKQQANQLKEVLIKNQIKEVNKDLLISEILGDPLTAGEFTSGHKRIPTVIKKQLQGSSSPIKEQEKYEAIFSKVVNDCSTAHAQKRIKFNINRIKEIISKQKRSPRSQEPSSSRRLESPNRMISPQRFNLMEQSPSAVPCLNTLTSDSYLRVQSDALQVQKPSLQVPQSNFRSTTLAIPNDLTPNQLNTLRVYSDTRQVLQSPLRTMDKQSQKASMGGGPSKKVPRSSTLPPLSHRYQANTSKEQQPALKISLRSQEEWFLGMQKRIGHLPPLEEKAPCKLKHWKLPKLPSQKADNDLKHGKSSEPVKIQKQQSKSKLNTSAESEPASKLKASAKVASVSKTTFSDWASADLKNFIGKMSGRASSKKMMYQTTTSSRVQAQAIPIKKQSPNNAKNSSVNFLMDKLKLKNLERLQQEAIKIVTTQSSEKKQFLRKLSRNFNEIQERVLETEEDERKKQAKVAKEKRATEVQARHRKNLKQLDFQAYQAYRHHVEGLRSKSTMDLFELTRLPNQDLMTSYKTAREFKPAKSRMISTSSTARIGPSDRAFEAVIQLQQKVAAAAGGESSRALNDLVIQNAPRTTSQQGTSSNAKKRTDGPPGSAGAAFPMSSLAKKRVPIASFERMSNPKRPGTVERMMEEIEAKQARATANHEQHTLDRIVSNRKMQKAHWETQDIRKLAYNTIQHESQKSQKEGRRGGIIFNKNLSLSTGKTMMNITMTPQRVAFRSSDNFSTAFNSNSKELELASRISQRVRMHKTSMEIRKKEKIEANEKRQKLNEMRRSKMSMKDEKIKLSSQRVFKQERQEFNQIERALKKSVEQQLKKGDQQANLQALQIERKEKARAIEEKHLKLYARNLLKKVVVNESERVQQRVPEKAKQEILRALIPLKKK